MQFIFIDIVYYWLYTFDRHVRKSIFIFLAYAKFGRQRVHFFFKLNMLSLKWIFSTSFHIRSVEIFSKDFFPENIRVMFIQLIRYFYQAEKIRNSVNIQSVQRKKEYKIKFVSLSDSK